MNSIFSINDLSNLKVEIHDGSKFFWMDNFYTNPDLVYEYITSIEPPIWKDWETPSYNMVYFEDRRHMINHPGMDDVVNKLSNILGQDITDDAYEPLNPEVLERHENEHYRPWTLKSDWKITYSFKAKYNRIVIFDGKKYKHGMDISNDTFFADSLEDAKFRINQVMFFQE